MCWPEGSGPAGLNWRSGLRFEGTGCKGGLRRRTMLGEEGYSVPCWQARLDQESEVAAAWLCGAWGPNAGCAG